MSDTCRTCGQAIEWCVTKRGKRMPVDKEPAIHDSGLLRLEPGHDAPRMAIPTTRLYRSHFATCPEADKWRKK